MFHQFLLHLATSITEHIIHLFQSLAFRLRNQKVSPDNREKTKRCKEKICSKACTIQHGRCSNAYDKVAKPDSRCRHGDTFRSSSVTEDFRWKCPGERRVGYPIDQHIDKGHGNTRPSSRGISGPVRGVLPHETSNDNIYHKHTDRSVDG